MQDLQLVRKKPTERGVRTSRSDGEQMMRNFYIWRSISDVNTITKKLRREYQKRNYQMKLIINICGAVRTRWNRGLAVQCMCKVQEEGGGIAFKSMTNITRADGKFKLGNVWVFSQLIHRPTSTINQLYKNPNIAQLETSYELWTSHMVFFCHCLLLPLRFLLPLSLLTLRVLWCLSRRPDRHRRHRLRRRRWAPSRRRGTWPELWCAIPLRRSGESR